MTIEEARAHYASVTSKDFPGMTPSEAQAKIEHWQKLAEACGNPGDLRIDMKTDRVVRLIERIWKEFYQEDGSLSYRSTTDYWHCEDLLTGEVYQISIWGWSKNCLSEMEALARVARDS